MNVVIGAKTDPGRRSNNEDQLAVVDVRRHDLNADGVLVIADGMGGRNFGEKASAVAVETVQDTLIEMLAAGHGDGVDTGEALTSALRKANARVYELGRQAEETRGMGTTCVAAVVRGDALSVAHAGDSRAYLLRDGTLERLTDDHSYVAEQVRAGVISEESAQRSRFRNVITRAVGIEPTITPDVSLFPVRVGDVLLLCTDGLTNMVPEDQIARVLQQHVSPQAIADRLVQIANRNGGKDNITAIVARLEVSNRTQQMRAAEMARREDPTQTPPMGFVDRTQQLRPADRTEQLTVEEGEAPPAARRPGASRPARRVPLWPVLVAVAVVLVGAARPILHLVRRALRGTTPAPGSRVVTPPPDLSHLHYQAPALLSVKPVQGGLLTLDPADGSVTVVTGAGQVVRISPTGAILSQSPPNPDLPPVAADGNQHFAADPQGNLYVSDTAERKIYRYSPDGRVGAISDPKYTGSLTATAPSSLAVAADGSLYVIDDQRLKVWRPAPPGYKPPVSITPLSVPSLGGFGTTNAHPITAPPAAGVRPATKSPKAHGPSHVGTSPAGPAETP